MLLAAFRVGRDAGWNLWAVGGVSIVVLAVGASALQAAGRASARAREREGAMF
jgi:hypothetical protein